MKIADLLPAPKKINVGNGQLEIRGLSLEEISKLLEKHSNDFLAIFQSIDTTNSDTKWATDILLKAPSLVIDVIAKGTNSEGQEQDIKKIIALEQADLFSEIMKLSFPNAQKLTELIQDATRLIGGLKGETLIDKIPAKSSKHK